MVANLETSARPSPDARQRILDSAYALFSRRGIRDVGIDEVIDRADVAKATLYHHFRSKDVKGVKTPIRLLEGEFG